MFLKTQLGLSLAPVDAKIPITSPNAAPAPMHIPNAFNILVGGTPAHNLATFAPMTMTLPGVGVASGTVMGPSREVTGKYNLLIKATPATRMTSMSIQNATNAPGIYLVPGQFKVLAF